MIEASLDNCCAKDVDDSWDKKVVGDALKIIVNDLKLKPNSFKVWRSYS